MPFTLNPLPLKYSALSNRPLFYFALIHRRHFAIGKESLDACYGAMDSFQGRTTTFVILDGFNTSVAL